jgi:hypothetical protein
MTINFHLFTLKTSCDSQPEGIVNRKIFGESILTEEGANSKWEINKLQRLANVNALLTEISGELPTLVEHILFTLII